MLKKLVNIFLILVLALQVLPVKQMGRMLFGNQWTEEMPHDADDIEKDMAKKAEGKSEFLLPTIESHTVVFTNACAYTHQLDCILPHNHSGDIHTPPPNC